MYLSEIRENLKFLILNTKTIVRDLRTITITAQRSEQESCFFSNHGLIT